MSYQNLYSMPCRLPQNRYSQPFEGEYNLTEHYKNKRNSSHSKAQQVCNCDCKPIVNYLRNLNENYDYDSRTFSESYEYEPTVEREGFKEPVNCKCADNNPPYRMENCGYNQSMSWKIQNMKPQGRVVVNNSSFQQSRQVEDNSVAPIPEQPPMVQQTPAPQQPSQTSELSCDCSVDDSPYILVRKKYNRSPTWNNQKDFRKNIQNYN